MQYVTSVFPYKRLFMLLISQLGSASSPSRDLSRLPLNVNSPASRYQPANASLSPKSKPTSPSRQQSVPPVDTPPRQSQELLYQDHLSTSPQSLSALSNSEDEYQQQRSDEIIFFERRKQEQQLIEERERELEMRTQELERDRLWLFNMRKNDENDSRDQPILRPRERRTSLRHQLERRLSQMDLHSLPETAPLGSSLPVATTPQPNPRPQYSFDTTHLIPPSSPTTNTPPATVHSPHSPRYRQNSQPSSPLQKTILETQYEQHGTPRFQGNDDRANEDTHAAYCGFESCSANKHKPSSGPSSDHPQPAPLKPQLKAKSGASWIRRFSMPVGNAFNLDSKRHQSNSSVSSTTSNYGVGSGISSSSTVQSSGGGRGLFSMDQRKNVSTTAIRNFGESKDRIQEDGRD